jgi:LmbE family N-acetylglucosaminyl deacetylase
MLRLGSPRTAMVIAPHPDDEAIGAAKLIRLLRQRGTQVWVVVVSDGSASHPGSRRWPRAKLVDERRRESRRALRRLGVCAGHIRFLGLPDGALSLPEARCTRAVRREIGRRRALDLLVGPAANDHHPDHRAVASAMDATRAARRLAYRIWPAGGRTRTRALRLSSGAATVSKRSLIRCYRTQCGAISDDPAGFSIARHELDAFAHPLEWFETVC